MKCVIHPTNRYVGHYDLLQFTAVTKQSKFKTSGEDVHEMYTRLYLTFV